MMCRIRNHPGIEAFCPHRSTVEMEVLMLRPVPFVVSARLVVSFCICLLALTACDAGDESATPGNNPPSNGAARNDSPPAPPKIDRTAIEPDATGAQMDFADLVHDFGDIYSTETPTHEFTFTNTGTKTLLIYSYRASCSCTVPQLDKFQYLPGESGRIIVGFNPPDPGPQEKKITLQTNDVRHPTIELVITADVTMFAEKSTRFLTFGDIQRGVEYRDTFTVTALDPEFEITEITIDHESISAREIPTVPERKGVRTIEVTIGDDIPWGPIHGARVYYTYQGSLPDGRPATRTDDVFVAGTVVDAIRCVPTALRPRSNNIDPGHAFWAEIQVQHAEGKSFKITSTRITDPSRADYDISVQSLGPLNRAYMIRVDGVAGSEEGYLRTFVAFKVSGEGLDPDEERLIPLITYIGQRK
jgi:hypothetical protein